MEMFDEIFPDHTAHQGAPGLDSFWEDFSQTVSSTVATSDVGSVGQLSPSSSTSALSGLLSPSGADAGAPFAAEVPDYMSSIKMENEHVGELFDDLNFSVFDNAGLPEVKTEVDDFGFMSNLKLQTLGDEDASGSSSEAEVKADLMWSSTTPNVMALEGRDRKVSLTLSECAESLFKDVDLLGSSPPMTGVNPGMVNNQMARSLQRNHSLDQDNVSDEEIDVVSDDNASTISACSTGSNNSSFYNYRNNATNNISGKTGPTAINNYNKTSSTAARQFQNVQAGRSLLRKNVNNQQVATSHNNSNRTVSSSATISQPIIDHMLSDHCYFQVRPQGAPVSPAAPLTPNESSEDEEALLGSRTAVSASRGQKRRLSPGDPNELPHCPRPRLSSASENVKFKFRMKFKPQGSPARGSAGVPPVRSHTKRKSAAKNTFCPSQNTEASNNASSAPAKVHGNKKNKDGSKPAKRARTNQSQDSEASSSHETPEAKNREIRDLHNSMERQRRVDLRVNFDQLKDVVPELNDMEKASKLTILNKSSEYCRSLTARDVKLRRDRDRELQRQQLLRKKLSALRQQLGGSSLPLSSGVRLSSGRVSVLNSSRH